MTSSVAAFSGVLPLQEAPRTPNVYGMPIWEQLERGLLGVSLESPDAVAPAKGAWKQPRLRGLSLAQRREIECTLARTGSVAATMQTTGASYRVVHTLMEWMAA